MTAPMPQQAINKALRKADFPTMIWHTLLLFFIGLALTTGLRLAADGAKGGWRKALEPIMLQGDVVRWHVWASIALTGLVAGYIAFLVRARLQARWKVSKVLLKAPAKAARWQAINRAVYWLGLATFVVAALSGAWLYFLPFLGLLELVGYVHEIASWALVAYMLIHVLAQFVLGGIRQLLKIFIPRVDLMQAGAAMTVAGMAGALGFVALDWSATRELTAARDSVAPVVDGKGDDAIWAKAAKQTVHTAHGWNVAGGEVPVEVQAAVVGDRVYFKTSWPDTTRSYMRLPLLKTAQGWQRMVGDTPGQTYDDADTTDYYEDKFAIAISPRNNPFAGSWHFGPAPLAGTVKALNSRGYHYTEDGSVVDLWHWKGSRSGATRQAEDSWFGTPVKWDPEKHAVRYSAGYASDKKDKGSGYQDNFKKGKHGWPVNHPSHIVTPLYLPKDLKALQARLGPNRSAFQMHGSEWDMGPDEIVPYSKELDDQIPVGTWIPALYWEKPISGPAGDVAAMGHWENGRWTLEFSRQMAAPDAQDVTIQDGVYLWFAAFDHNQTRHSWHPIPLKLRLPQ
ncbi:ethylbenzene dehydrogenase-related protein [Pseudogulbenkiania sp. MAI-1]|uniref:ethylbenzene dehydrogenase-related protein n=1 Tax=Pseudogulbenkiania sp. MAI-1 TaxID=990370 RepID=UPI00045EAFF9|nr:ethylbenzene dehydrogenase-related protein [Pseudogulbenkiania sp. MAI-1]